MRGELATDDEMVEEHKQLGPYTLHRKIGSGGMAEVWMAQRAVIGDVRKTVALKMLNAVSREKPEYREMFLDEARLSTLLNHSTIVQVFDAGECEGECFMAMEWVDGVNLSQLNAMLWERGERLPLHVATYIIGEVLRALDHAHNLRTHESASIVHRDVSPQNVMLSVAGEVKLMDFGVARFATEETAGIHVKGKLRYMPPEQVQGQSREPTVDLFAVGAVLHEMLEGRRFRNEWDDLQLLTKIMDGAVPPLSQPDELPKQVVNVMYGLLEANTQIRIGSARGALRMLTEWPGYRNAAIDLESYVTRYRDIMPPPLPPPGTAASGDIQARIAARVAASAAAAHDESSRRRLWRGVNPSTGTTLDQLDGHAVDDTNVGTLAAGRGSLLRRAAALAIGALALSLASLTMWLAFEVSSDGDEADAEIAAVSPEPEPEPEPEPQPQ
ncbi:serine/threonine-protein kinase, partial [Enhygromyxa salina]|uniref:serine/threonine-protein kinase n=1 Tax=Enhygromyxa salina TaxID=215803 RepID=UPI000D08A95E